MSDRFITTEEAQKRLSELEAMSDWTGEDRIAAEYARTVIAQAEQIKRLQQAVTESEVIFWEATGHDLEQQLERKGVQLERDDLEGK